MQQSVARGMQAAGENPNGGAGAMAFMGMGLNAVGGAVGGIQQPASQSGQESEDQYEKLSKLKKMLDEGLITQEDYDAQKKKILGV